MFADALRALATFTSEVTGRPTRIGGPKGPAAGGAGQIPETVAADGTTAVAESDMNLSLVSVIRTDRFRNTNREVGGGSNGNGVAIRQSPGWFDLTVAVEAGGDQLSAAEALERVLTAVVRAGDLSTALHVESEYPVYASLDTPTAEELQSWWQSGLLATRGAALRAVVTVALQPHEFAPVEIVRSRRIHTDDRRTNVRETVER
jgi:hypothetical protein